MIAGVRTRVGHLRDRARRSLDARRRPRWGNLRRKRPFSSRYGFDRGTPIDRVYLDRFFSSNAAAIRGAVLEVKDAEFSARFGRGVTSTDLLDIDPVNVRATVVADLADRGSVPESAFDCVLIPQTLQYVRDPFDAVAAAWAAVRPGGTLLVTAPTVARLDPQLAAVDRWRLTPAGMQRLLEASCPGASISVSAYGGLVATMAFLLGLAAEELDERDLDVDDPDHPLLVCGCAAREADR